MHSELFRVTMRSLGLDDGYGHYVDRVPAVRLAVSNLMSLFGFHRRWLGAALGHLAAFEMTSSVPNRRHANGLRRLGGDAAARRFYDEHVEADAVHEQIAAHDLCGTFARENPSAVGDVLFGAACALAVEAEVGRMLLARWDEGRSYLRPASGSAPAGGRAEAADLVVPSQNGLSAESPHRHSATVFRPGSMSSPSGERSSKGPRTSNGPFSYGVMVTTSVASSFTGPGYPARGPLTPTVPPRSLAFDPSLEPIRLAGQPAMDHGTRSRRWCRHFPDCRLADCAAGYLVGHRQHGGGCR